MKQIPEGYVFTTVENYADVVARELVIRLASSRYRPRDEFDTQRMVQGLLSEAMTNVADAATKSAHQKACQIIGKMMCLAFVAGGLLSYLIFQVTTA